MSNRPEWMERLLGAAGKLPRAEVLAIVNGLTAADLPFMYELVREHKDTVPPVLWRRFKRLLEEQPLKQQLRYLEFDEAQDAIWTCQDTYHLEVTYISVRDKVGSTDARVPWYILTGYLKDELRQRGLKDGKDYLAEVETFAGAVARPPQPPAVDDAGSSSEEDRMRHGEALYQLITADWHAVLSFTIEDCEDTLHYMSVHQQDDHVTFASVYGQQAQVARRAAHPVGENAESTPAETAQPRLPTHEELDARIPEMIRASREPLTAHVITEMLFHEFGNVDPAQVAEALRRMLSRPGVNIAVRGVKAEVQYVPVGEAPVRSASIGVSEVVIVADTEAAADDVDTATVLEAELVTDAPEERLPAIRPLYALDLRPAVDDVQLREICQEWLDGQPFDIHRLTAECHGYTQGIAENILQVGRRLVALKESLTHGDWHKWLASSGLPIRERSARMYMAVARGVAQRPELRRYVDGGIKKAHLILELPDPALDELAEHGTVNGEPLSDVTTMNSGELKKRVQSLKKQLTESQHERAKLSAKLEEQVAETKFFKEKLGEYTAGVRNPSKAEQEVLERLEQLSRSIEQVASYLDLVDVGALPEETAGKVGAFGQWLHWRTERLALQFASRLADVGFGPGPSRVDLLENDKRREAFAEEWPENPLDPPSPARRLRAVGS